MKRKTCKHYDIPGHSHELTFSCYNQHPFLANPEFGYEFIRTIILARRKHQFDLWAYVLMPDHVHILIYPQPREWEYSSYNAWQNDGKGVLDVDAESVPYI